MGFGVSYQVSSILGVAYTALVPVYGGLAGGVAAIGYLNFGQRFGRLLGGVDDIIGRVAFPAFSRLQGDVERMIAACSGELSQPVFTTFNELARPG